jgi:SAM-dependent methyltransferase
MAVTGCVDRVATRQIDGWAFHEEDPSEHLIVTVRLEGAEIGSSSANLFREDLKEAEIGAGDHAYLIELTQPIEESQFEQIVALATSRSGQSQLLSLPLPTGKSEEAEERLRTLERQLAKCLKGGLMYAEASELLPPVGCLKDFMNEDVLETCAALMQCGIDEVRERTALDVYPIPHPHNREGYAAGDDLGYWLSGYADFSTLRRLANEYGVKGGRVFDFGGATGRVFRNFAIQTDEWEVWSCDFKMSSVEFNLKYFPTKIRAFFNATFPSLPIPDSCFDLITACSVFTHIDETETGWLLELRRVLKPGGIACISIHNEDTWKQLKGDLLRDVATFRPDIATSPELPEGKTVVTFRPDDPYRCQTFHSTQYIHRNWGRFFEICDIRPMTLGIQALVICRRLD